jgi:hypothetical protein
MPSLTLVAQVVGTSLHNDCLFTDTVLVLSYPLSSIPASTGFSMQHAVLLFDVQCLITLWYHRSQLANLPPISIVCVW